MTRFMRVIHVFPCNGSAKKDVDGPDKPGHDEVGETPKGPHAALRFMR